MAAPRRRAAARRRQRRAATPRRAPRPRHSMHVSATLRVSPKHAGAWLMCAFTDGCSPCIAILPAALYGELAVLRGCCCSDG